MQNTDKNAPAMAQRLESLYMAAQQAQITLPVLKPDADDLLRSSGVGRYDPIAVRQRTEQQSQHPMHSTKISFVHRIQNWLCRLRLH
jgi:hypothetical protein